MMTEKISTGTVIALAGLAAGGVGAWMSLSAALATVETTTREHERRLNEAATDAAERAASITRMQVDIAGIAADVRYLRQTMEKDGRK